MRVSSLFRYFSVTATSLSQDSRLGMHGLGGSAWSGFRDFALAGWQLWPAETANTRLRGGVPERGGGHGELPVFLFFRDSSLFATNFFLFAIRHRFEVSAD